MLAAFGRTKSREPGDGTGDKRSSTRDSKQSGTSSGLSKDSGNKSASSGSDEAKEPTQKVAVRRDYGRSRRKSKIAKKEDAEDGASNEDTDRKPSRKTQRKGTRDEGRKGTRGASERKPSRKSTRSGTSGGTSRKGTRPSKATSSGSGGRSRSDTTESDSDYSESTSDDEELAEEDWDNLNQDHLPLYLREQRIKRASQVGWEEIDPEKLKENEEQLQQAARPSIEQIMGRDLYVMPGDQIEEEEVPRTSPNLPIHRKILYLKIQMGVYLFWVVLAVALLALFVYRYFFAIQGDAQRTAVDSAVVRVQIVTATKLTPAFNVVRALALAVRSGYFNETQSSHDKNPRDILRGILTPEFLAHPVLEQIDVAGIIKDKVLVVRPNSIRDEEEFYTFRYLKLQNSRACDLEIRPFEEVPRAKDCLSPALNETRILPAADLSARVGWQYPSWLSPDYIPLRERHAQGPTPSPTPLSMNKRWMYHEGDFVDALDLEYWDKWRFVHRLGADLNLESSIFAAGDVVIQVAINLRELVSEISKAAPAGGYIYVCTEDGRLLAGSEDGKGWVPKPYTTPQDTVVFQRLQDLGHPWVSEVVTAENMLVEAEFAPDFLEERWAETALGADLVAVAALQVGATGSGSRQAARKTLRVVCYAPFEKMLPPQWKFLIYGSIGAAALPVVVGVLACLGRSCLLLVTWIKRKRERDRAARNAGLSGASGVSGDYQWEESDDEGEDEDE